MQLSQHSFTYVTVGARVARLTLTRVAVYAVMAGRSVHTRLTTAVVIICYIECVLTCLTILYPTCTYFACQLCFSKSQCLSLTSM